MHNVIDRLLNSLMKRTPGAAAGSAALEKPSRFSRGPLRLRPACYLGLSLLSFGAHADTDAGSGAPNQGDGLAEVTVTAERRETKLQDTPVSVGVIGGDQLNLAAAPLSRDLNGAVAGVIAPGAYQGSSGGVFYIRGIGTATTTLSGAVPLYVDDVYIARTLGSGLYLGMPDVERVELLRGPQGTLYGENSSAGAVKIVSRDPTENSAWVEGSVGSEDSVGAKLYASAVLDPDVLYGSIAFDRYKDKGYTYNATLHEEVDATDYNQARGKLKWTPGGGFEAVLSIDWTQDVSDQVSPIPLNIPGAAPGTTYENTNPRISRDIGGAALHVSQVIDEHLTFKSISAYRAFGDNHYPVPIDGLPTDAYGLLLNLHQHQLTQEFQLLGDYERVNFTAGVIGLREGFSVARPSWTDEIYGGIVSDVNNTSVAAYGQGTYRLTDHLDLTAGLRFNRDMQVFNEFGYKSNVTLAQLATKFETGRLTDDVDSTTPKLGLDYHWTPDLFSYASVTRGEKAGGYNPVSATLPIAKVVIQPEKVTTYELGTKASVLDDRLQPKIAVFYNDFTNLQGTVQNPVIDGVVINGSVTDNAGKAHIYGTEIEIAARPIAALYLNTAVTLLQGKFVQFDNPTGVPAYDYVGNLLPLLSHSMFSENAVYTLPQFGLPGVAQLDSTLRFISYFYQDIPNEIKSPSQTYLDVGAHYAAPGGHWSGQVKVRNALDRRYELSNYEIPALGVNSALYNPPRTFQVSARYDF